MLKYDQKLKHENLETNVAEALDALLSKIPFLSVKSTRRGFQHGTQEVDLQLDIAINEKPWRILVEVKRNGQPRAIREALFRLQHLIKETGDQATYGLIAAPFLSAQSIGLCQDAGLGYLDLAGNAGLSFDQVFIERQVADNPFKEKRQQRSLYTRKSGRILRVMLTPPIRSWTVMELAEATDVSLGQISNVRTMLLDRELAVVERDGIRLSNPEALAREWQSVYKQNSEQQTMYTLLHGEALERATRQALSNSEEGDHAVLASFSAAQWIAPFARQATQLFYADAAGEKRIKESLALRPVAEGGNVIIFRPQEDDVFSGRIQPAPGLWCTGLVQTWLDLGTGGERGVEAAEHLLAETLLPAWQAATAK